jgi:hypothetical protein
MKKKLSWQAYSNEDRHGIIEAVKDAISVSAGCIIHFNMFSDLALSLNLKIEEEGVQELHDALSGILKVSDFDPADINPKSRKEIFLFINISFGSGEGTMKREVPG